MTKVILSTKDYSIFKYFSSNREVDPKHVNKLVNAIRERNLLAENPIKVDPSMRIIDGQHRLAAAEILGEEIYYIVSQLVRKDISILNSYQKNWNAMDYINYYTIEKVPEFIALSHLINTYPEMSISALITLCSSTNSRNLADLKNGYLDMLSKNQAVEICEFCKTLVEKFDFKFSFDSRFPLALKMAFNSTGFKPEVLLEKIESAPRSFVQCHTKNQYIGMIEQIYNYGLSKNKIYIHL